MALLDLTIVKRHLRVYHDDDDTEIALYRAAAEAIIVEYLDRPVLRSDPPDEGDEDYDPTAMKVTPAITAAVLLLVGDLYENREPDPKAQGDAVLPNAVRALLAPWRIWRCIDDV